MANTIDFTEAYKALTPYRRRKIMSTLKYWGCWSRQTVYRKLAGESVTPLEHVMISGVMSVYQTEPHPEQLAIGFEWNDGLALVN